MTEKAEIDDKQGCLLGYPFKFLVILGGCPDYSPQTAQATGQDPATGH